MWSSEPFNYQTTAAAVGQVLLDQKGISAPIYLDSGGGNGTFTGVNAPDVGSGVNGISNRALLIAVCVTSYPVVVVTGVTHNGKAMDLVGSELFTEATPNILFYGIKNPDTGNNNVVVSWTGNGEVTLAWLSVVGADQTGGTTTFHGADGNTNFGGSEANPSTVTAPAAAGNELTLAAHISIIAFVSGNYNDVGKSVGTIYWKMAANYAGVAAPTMTYDMTGPGFFLAAECAIKAI